LPPGAVVCPAESNTCAIAPLPKATMITTPQNSTKGSLRVALIRDHLSFRLSARSLSSLRGAFGCKPSALLGSGRLIFLRDALLTLGYELRSFDVGFDSCVKSGSWLVGPRCSYSLYVLVVSLLHSLEEHGCGTVAMSRHAVNKDC
jgi:hypothetical protein